jgi:hypothetical protein
MAGLDNSLELVRYPVLRGLASHYSLRLGLLQKFDGPLDGWVIRSPAAGGPWEGLEPSLTVLRTLRFAHRYGTMG